MELYGAMELHSRSNYLGIIDEEERGIFRVWACHDFATSCFRADAHCLLVAQGGYIPLADGRVRRDVPLESSVYYRRLLEKVTKR